MILKTKQPNGRTVLGCMTWRVTLQCDRAFYLNRIVVFFLIMQSMFESFKVLLATSGKNYNSVCHRREAQSWKLFMKIYMKYMWYWRRLNKAETQKPDGRRVLGCMTSRVTWRFPWGFYLCGIVVGILVMQSRFRAYIVLLVNSVITHPSFCDSRINTH